MGVSQMRWPVDSMLHFYLFPASRNTNNVFFFLFKDIPSMYVIVLQVLHWYVGFGWFQERVGCGDRNRSGAWHTQNTCPTSRFHPWPHWLVQFCFSFRYGLGRAGDYRHSLTHACKLSTTEQHLQFNPLKGSGLKAA